MAKNHSENNGKKPLFWEWEFSILVKGVLNLLGNFHYFKNGKFPFIFNSEWKKSILKSYGGLPFNSVWVLFIKVIKKAYQNLQTFVSIATVQWHINATDFVLVFILIFIPFLSVWGIVKNVHLSQKCLYQKILYDFSSSTLNTFDPFTSLKSE